MDTQNRRRRRRRRRIRIQPRFIIVLLLFLVVVVLAVLAIRGIGGGRQEQQEGSGGGFLSGLFSTPTPEPTPVPTPSPSPTPVPRFDTPHAVDASNPANWGYTTDVEVNGAVVESYTRAEPIYFDYDTPYTNVNGIVTFRGDNYRSGAAYGTASISSRQLSELWSFDIGQMAKPGGSGFLHPVVPDCGVYPFKGFRPGSFNGFCHIRGLGGDGKIHAAPPCKRFQLRAAQPAAFAVSSGSKDPLAQSVHLCEYVFRGVNH